MPVVRPDNIPTPCDICPKIPQDAPQRHRHYAIEFDDQARECWNFYWECKAVGQFPDDDAVRLMARLFAQMEKECERVLEDRRFLRLQSAIWTGLGIGTLPHRRPL